VVFLDSHCEVGLNWLQPLLARIQNGGGHVVVTPVIDSIHYDTLQVEAVSSYLRGGFDWRLDFFWEWITASDRAKRKRQDFHCVIKKIRKKCKN
jgi:polypeptide N-acetylgalactosaminyltransferase